MTGSDYGTVRTAAFMGYRIIADVSAAASIDAAMAFASPTRAGTAIWRTLRPSEFESRFAAHLPERMGRRVLRDTRGSPTR